MKLFTLYNVEKRYGDKLALCNVNLEVEKSEILAVVGPNGAGKTTLLKIMALIDLPSKGELYYGDIKICKDNIERFRRRCTMVFQKNMFFDTSVYENIAYGLKLRRLPKKEINRRVHEALQLVKLEGYAKRQARKLSGGEQQRVSLARALALETELLLLDEPTANLDPKTVSIIEEAIADVNRRMKTTIVIATHNMFQAQNMTHRTALILNGKIVEVGKTKEIFTSSTRLKSFAPIENVFSGNAEPNPDGTTTIEIGEGIKIQAAIDMQGRVSIFVQPEDIILSRQPVISSARNVLEGKVVEVSDYGSIVKLRVEVKGLSFIVQITKRSFIEMGLRLGSKVFLTFKASSVRLV